MSDDIVIEIAEGPTLDVAAARLLAHAEIATNSGAIATTEGAGGTDVTGLSVDVDCDGGPITIVARGLVLYTSTAASQSATIRVLEATTEIERDAIQAVNATNPFAHLGKILICRRLTPSAGVHTYKINAFITGGTSVILLGSDLSTPNYGNRQHFNLDVYTATLTT